MRYKSSSSAGAEYTSTCWVDSKSPKFSDPSLYVFALNNGKKNRAANAQTSFTIESPYGEIKPRLVMQKKNPYVWTNLIITRRDRDGYKDAEQALFKIDRID